MLKIRLQRVGRKNFPLFRIVLTNNKNPIKGKISEILGFYNPRQKKYNLKEDKLKYWIGQGVKFSPTLHNLFIDRGLISGKKIIVWKPQKSKSEETDKQNEVEVKKEENIAPAEQKA